MITPHDADALNRLALDCEELKPFRSVPRDPTWASLFDVWYAELVELGKKHNWPITDPADWREYFNDGYTPMEAMSEDVSYGMDG